MRARDLLGSALVSGGAATLTSLAAMAIVARLEGKASLRPINATSHWLNGERAGLVSRFDAAHTTVGLATHAAATVFWACLFARLAGPSRPTTIAPLVRDAVAVSSLAALVDYTITPKRFTPGWELVLTKRSMAVIYAAMAAGMAASRL